MKNDLKILESAAVVVVDHDVWRAFGAGISASFRGIPLPPVEVPVLDISSVDDDTCAAIMKAHRTARGVVNASGMITEFLQAGAVKRDEG